MLILINHYIVRMEILTNPDTHLSQQKLGVQERAKTCLKHNETWKNYLSSAAGMQNTQALQSPAQDP